MIRIPLWDRLPAEKQKSLMELFLYGVTGVLTTVVNYIVYALMLLAMGDDPTSGELFIAVLLAWFIAVLFAYYANRLLVFRTGSIRGKAMLREAGLFFAARVLSLVMEAVLVEISVTHMGMDEFLVKIPINVLVIIANYFASKLVVFKK